MNMNYLPVVMQMCMSVTHSVTARTVDTMVKYERKQAERENQKESKIKYFSKTRTLPLVNPGRYALGNYSLYSPNINSQLSRPEKSWPSLC